MLKDQSIKKLRTKKVSAVKKTPANKKQVRRKVKDILQGKLVEGPGIDPQLQAEIVLAMRRQSNERAFATSILNRDMGVLESVITEYLKSFVVIGYDLNGDKISITHVNNTQEYDSILEHSRGTLLQMVMQAQQNLPPPI